MQPLKVTPSVATLALGSHQGKGLQGCEPREEARVWKKVWRNEPSHSQGNFTLGVGVPMNSQMFKKNL